MTTVRLRPHSVMLSDLGVALDRHGQCAEAVSQHFAALQIQLQRDHLLAARNVRAPTTETVPRAVILRCRLAYALDHRGDHTGAKEFYSAALRRDPGWPEKCAVKAWRLATDPNPDLRDAPEAYDLADQAVSAVGDPSASQLDTLAAAEAAAGKFLEAVRTEQQALDKASTSEGQPSPIPFESTFASFNKGNRSSALSANATQTPSVSEPWDLRPSDRESDP